MFEELTQAAIHHAREHHGVQLDLESIALLDRILDDERSIGDLSSLESLVLCYGAWVGQYLIRNRDGQWVGLHEPTPPRVSIAGIRYSPMDAVRRRLVDPKNPKLLELIESATTKSLSNEDLARITDRNRMAWDQMGSDSRFVHQEAFSLDREALLESIDPWLRNEPHLGGKNLLCLGAGGGMHSPIFASLGMNVTVVDLSERQLDLDRRLAIRLGLSICTVRTSLDHLAAFEENSFDLVIQPVSMSYVSNCQAAYQEVARVLRPEGLYLVQHKNPVSLQARSRSDERGFTIDRSRNAGPILDPSSDPSPYREHETYEFLHTLDSLIGDLCRCGFSIEDFQEPVRDDAWAPVGTQAYRANFIPPYFKIKARRQRT
jgi:2-polyprenyl-3-methyl-5-hydroxy-6-metoxy-1,4-benzoquinol methylase